MAPQSKNEGKKSGILLALTTQIKKPKSQIERKNAEMVLQAPIRRRSPFNSKYSSPSSSLSSSLHCYQSHCKPTLHTFNTLSRL